MKKFIIIVCVLVLLAFAVDTAYYRLGWYIELNPGDTPTTFVRTEGDQLMMYNGKDYEPFEVKGVNLGSGKPGEWSTDFAIDKETYMRWFKYIQEMGANTIRVYTVQQDVFYNAFYEYNKNNDHPLWLIHGVWVNDYVQNSHRDALEPGFKERFLSDCRTMLDVIHGNKKIGLGRMASAGSGFYLNDVSQWIIGYILGVEWEDVTVVYTNEQYKDIEGASEYKGKYFYTSPEATPFEAMLTEVGDRVVEYESNRYKTQKPIAFSNWPTTDPFKYPKEIESFFMKCAEVDVEHIKTTEDFLSGQFVSYHVYPYYPDYLAYVKDWSELGFDDLSEFYTDGVLNTYRAYLKMLTKHHTMPVVISEFGVSTGRGMAQREMNLGRNQGNMSEKQQGKAILDCYKDIKAAGCSGCCVFSWQDEWFKRTWNTMYAVNLKRTPYWSDYQTNEQYFGLMSFDPGEEKSVCYVDGSNSEWKDADIVADRGDMKLSMKYDEKFIYFMVQKNGLNIDSDKIYIPLDITPNSGSSYYEEKNMLFDRAVDFVIQLEGKKNSRVRVQERYEVLRSNYSENVYEFNTYLKNNIPAKDSTRFTNIDMILQTATPLLYNNLQAPAEVFETGKLTYGNANPDSSDFNSLADFMAGDGFVEIKLPWQLLNFADPSQMMIHDDYYKHYGIEYIEIDKLWAGLAGDGNGGKRRAELKPFKLSGWNNQVTYHERLKSSYYVLQKQWRYNDED